MDEEKYAIEINDVESCVHENGEFVFSAGEPPSITKTKTVRPKWCKVTSIATATRPSVRALKEALGAKCKSSFAYGGSERSTYRTSYAQCGCSDQYRERCRVRVRFVRAEGNYIIELNQLEVESCFHENGEFLFPKKKPEDFTA
jgi:hypothetical protein